MLLLEECLTTFSHDLLEIVDEIVPHGFEGVICPSAAVLDILHDSPAKWRRLHLGNTRLRLGHDLVHFVFVISIQT